MKKNLKNLLLSLTAMGFLYTSCSDEDSSNELNNEILKTNNTQSKTPLVQQNNNTVLYDNLPFKDSNVFSEFVVQGNKWNKNNLTYYYDNGTADIVNDLEKDAIREAFDLWAAVTPLTFTEVYGTNADIIIHFGEREHGDGYPFDGVGGVLAHAFYPPPNSGSLAGDMHFDDSETWTLSLTSLPSNPRDLVTVAAHEIGHSLGLRHSDVPEALMYPFYNGSHRFLDDDDINGIQSIYGSNFNLSVWTNSFTTNTRWNNTNRVRTLADVNGDGKADIVGFGDDKVYVALSNGNGFNTAQAWTNSFTTNSGWNNIKRVRTLADVNGDGKADIVGFGDDSVYVLINTYPF